MKKTTVLLLYMAGLMLISTSCRSSKEIVTLSSIDGEWNIVEINGSAVVPVPGQEYPSIGFEASTGKIYGNSGCNRIMGSFDTATKPGTINFSDIGTTRMFCPDMTTEQNILNALKYVKGYRKLSNNRIALTNSSNRPVVVLSNKALMNMSTLSALEGEWKIIKVNDEPIPADLEVKPFLSFETGKKSVHGNAGCNLINGGFTTDESNIKSISFPALAATMMACPDMTTERKIMHALNHVTSFNILTEKSAGLYGEDGKMLLLLIR